MVEALTPEPGIVANAEYLFQLAETIRAYVEATWGEWHEDVARAGIADDIAHGRMFIVRADGALVGLMSVRDEPTHIHKTRIPVSCFAMACRWRSQHSPFDCAVSKQLPQVFGKALEACGLVKLT
jgi:hypothetical protein